jgi:beta-mannosidase
MASFVPNKHLDLAEPGISVQPSINGGMVELKVSTKSLARFIELVLEGADVIFSDNYFDLPAGYDAVITCPLPEGWTLEKVSQQLRVQSLYHAFA